MYRGWTFNAIKFKQNSFGWKDWFITRLQDCIDNTLINSFYQIMFNFHDQFASVHFKV